MHAFVFIKGDSDVMRPYVHVMRFYLHTFVFGEEDSDGLGFYEHIYVCNFRLVMFWALCTNIYDLFVG